MPCVCVPSGALWLRWMQPHIHRDSISQRAFTARPSRPRVPPQRPQCWPLADARLYPGPIAEARPAPFPCRGAWSTLAAAGSTVSRSRSTDCAILTAKCSARVGRAGKLVRGGGRVRGVSATSCSVLRRLVVLRLVESVARRAQDVMEERSAPPTRSAKQRRVSRVG